MSFDDVFVAVWLVGMALLVWPIAGLVVKEMLATGPLSASVGDAVAVGLFTFLLLVTWPVLVPVWALGRWAIGLQGGTDDE